VINVATGRRTSLNELWQAIRGITGARVEARHLPARAGDVRASVADLSRARELLGFEPAIDLHEGLRRTVEHFAKHALSTGS
jgi:nucleoside-diphosphate-sugar epimerase